MEEKFYLDDFELSLKEHADQFKMVPSKKVWHGIYNDLHPGRRWPSVIVSLVLLSSIVFIGYINTQTDTNSNAEMQATPVATPDSKLAKNDISYVDKIVPVSINKETVGKSKGVANTLAKTTTVREKGANIESTAVKSAVTKGSTTVLEVETSRIDDAQVLNFDDKNVGDDDQWADVNTLNENVETAVPFNDELAASNGKGNIALPSRDVITLASFGTTAKINSAAPNQKIEVTSDEMPGMIDTKIQLAGQKVNTATVKKGNGRISWVYYASPFVSSVSLKGAPLREDINSNNSLATPLPQVNHKSATVVRHAALGFEAGVQMNYLLARGLHVTAGAHFTRSGYNIVSNLVHPTLSTLVLKNPSSGAIYSRNFVTHYGDGTGRSPVTLNNYSYQASIPVGLQYMLWDGSSFQVNLGTSVEPSLVLKANAYMLSSDGKNYVNVPDLLRKWNLSTNFAPFVSFRSDKFKWNIGPNIRYQWLSTYQKNYSMKEHLVDYGIRVGISK